MITKPTPTALPPATAYFNVPNNYSLWASTDYAIQSWNLLGDARLVIQAVLLIVIIVVGIYVLSRFVADFTRKDADE